jgi:hypothetical protein
LQLQQQALMQANQQQLHALQQQQAAHQQLLAQQSAPVNFQPNQWGQQQQPEQSGVGTFMNSVMGGPQQQTQADKEIHSRLCRTSLILS